MDAHITSTFHFLRSTHAQKDKEITFLMQLITCPNSTKIIENHQNDVLTTTTGIANSNACCYCASTGLIPHRSPNLGLSYLKSDARITVSNLVTRTHVRVRERPRGFGEAVHASRQRPRGWLGRQCACVGGGASGDRS
jgi:hypothetical protein